MITARLDELELMEGWAEEDPSIRLRVGDERGRLAAGEIALVPEMVPTCTTPGRSSLPSMSR